MTTFLYTTTSTGGKISNRNAVESLVERYYFTVEPDVSDDRVSFRSTSEPNNGFGVFETPNQNVEAEQEFFSELADYLESSLSVKCVEVQGVGDPAVWKWSVTEDGTVSVNSL